MTCTFSFFSLSFKSSFVWLVSRSWQAVRKWIFTVTLIILVVSKRRSTCLPWTNDQFIAHRPSSQNEQWSNTPVVIFEAFLWFDIDTSQKFSFWQVIMMWLSLFKILFGHYSAFIDRVTATCCRLDSNPGCSCKGSALYMGRTFLPTELIAPHGMFKLKGFFTHMQAVTTNGLKFKLCIIWALSVLAMLLLWAIQTGQKNYTALLLWSLKWQKLCHTRLQPDLSKMWDLDSDLYLSVEANKMLMIWKCLSMSQQWQWHWP